MSGVLRSLRIRNYRIWAVGAIVSNTGTWMQRTAQDWMVLTQLTQHNATAVGAVLACQFAPQLLFLPVTGLAADRFNRRTVLMVTQAAMSVLSLSFGALTLTGHIQLWHVYVLASLFGTAAAFDAPVRHTFVSELVDTPLLSNAVALNSTSFNSARMLGPAIAGVMIGVTDVGWVFVVGAASFAAVLASLFLIRTAELRRPPVPLESRPGNMADGFRHVLKRSDLRTVILMFFLAGSFCNNFQIFIPAMTVSVFGRGPGAFGLLSSVLAVGSVIGALLAARRESLAFSQLLTGAAVFTAALGLGAVAPTFVLFAVALIVVGTAVQTFATAAFSLVQLSTEPELRGRVMAIMLAAGLGGTLVGGPVVGAISDAFGPRWSVATGAFAGLTVLAIGTHHQVRGRRR
ncbi:MFS transporter [Streptomyces umbrinus]|uniref:MFS transporter n=1 Tax=Streptomyces umbrinus TaxID=67370 RepID=UPI003C2BE3AB